MRHGEIGLVSPGEMGAAVGRQLAASGRTVRWASADRSEATAARARDHGIDDVVGIEALAAGSTLILSVCPPQAALDVARSLVGFEGVYVDANAIAPRTATAVAAVVEAGGATYVDGGIIGPPPRSPGTTRLYLSGELSPEVAALFEGTLVEAVVVPGERMAASALKMAFAAWTKGSAALLLAAQQAARATGVEDELSSEWVRLDPKLESRVTAAAAARASKGWRWAPEMGEVASAFADLGLPTGFHDAAATMYERRTS